MHPLTSGLALALPLFLSLPAGVPSAHMNGGAEQTIARLVPEGATIFLQAGSVDAFDRLARDLVGAVNPEALEGFDVHSLLTEMEVPGDLTLIDASRPIALALSLSMSGPPATTVIVPVSDASAYGASLGGKPWHELDGYVGVSAAEGYAARAEAHPLAVGLPTTVLAGRIDLDEIFKMYAPMIEFGLTQIEQLATMQNPSPDIDMGPMIDWYIEGIENFIDSADQMDIGLASRGSELDGTFKLSTHPDSPMSACASEGETGIANLAACVDPSDSMAFLGGMDMAAMMASFEDLWDSAFGMYPEPVRGQLQDMMTAFEDMYPLMGDAFAGSGGFGSSGMRFAYYLDSPEPQKLIETYGKAFGALATEGGMFELEGPVAEKRGDVDVTRFTMNITDEGLRAVTEDTEEIDEEALAQIRSLIDAIYGKDGLRFAMAGQGNRIVFSMGGDDAFLDSVLGRLGASGAAKGKIQPMVSRVAGANPCMVFHMDLAELMDQMVDAMGPIMGEEASEIPDLSGLSVPMLMYGGVRGLEWSGGLNFDLAKMAKFIEAMDG